MTMYAGPGMNAGLRNPDSYIVCHLRFDDDGARELTGMPITLAGGASVSATNARHHGMALQIGAGDYCQIAHNGALDFLYQNGVPWSIAMWMTGFDNTGGTLPSIIALQASVGRMVVMWWSAKRVIYLNIRNAENDVVVNAFGYKGPTTAGMHYLVITYDQALSSQNAKIYVDGTLLGTGDKLASPSTGSSNTALNIGYHSARSSYGEFPMSIDELVIYKGIAIDGTVVPTRRR
jgi:hypothetical protein